ncbi:MAG: hypothetical protein Q8M51_13135 [Polaromonas sp.]|uniref:hypothetical protein n=1 Tax=Polaromonas sp. TaxID=1869339 RepID=UPI00272F56AB|nr:hypothetical protein [Polaromonas sp.]MDP1741556.1 hypothetical protein [Polaromonas sp.]MDP2033075.1 hypothetical protein [Polaromonas sp.]MDP3356787.1 hypothetical protein [Polaromonas sp.]MDP3753723.1 hypothetical protein [Polaromonas sp.]
MRSFEKNQDVSWLTDICGAKSAHKNYGGVMTILSIVRNKLQQKELIYITAGY